jgi:hypothetical protein
MGLRIVPVDLKTAREFVAVHHRHNDPPVGHKFSVGVADGAQLVGVAIVGRRSLSGTTGSSRTRRVLSPGRAFARPGSVWSRSAPPRPGWDAPSRRRTNKADNVPRTLWDAPTDTASVPQEGNKR